MSSRASGSSVGRNRSAYQRSRRCRRRRSAPTRAGRPASPRRRRRRPAPAATRSGSASRGGGAFRSCRRSRLSGALSGRSSQKTERILEPLGARRVTPHLRAAVAGRGRARRSARGTGFVVRISTSPATTPSSSSHRSSGTSGSIRSVLPGSADGEAHDLGAPLARVPLRVPGAPRPQPLVQPLDHAPQPTRRVESGYASSSQTAIATGTVPGRRGSSRTARRALRSADPARSISSSNVSACAGHAAMPDGRLRLRTVLGARPGDRPQHALRRDRRRAAVRLGHDHPELGRSDPACHVDRADAAADRLAEASHRLPPPRSA